MKDLHVYIVYPEAIPPAYVVADNENGQIVMCDLTKDFDPCKISFYLPDSI
jgi:hypothetical protein